MALITAATASATSDACVRADDLGSGQETVLARSDRDNFSLVQVQGTPPDASLDNVFWRGAGQVGDQTVGLAIYEGAQGGTLGASAPDLLMQTLKRTQDQTAAQKVAGQGKSATTPAKRTGQGFLASLFE